MKTGNGRTLTALAILAAILVAFGGCENFMSKDKSFKESIEKEVKVANAKEFKILVLGITGQATTSPTGKTTQKVDVPFSVLVQPSEAYGFIEWQAFSTTDTAQEVPLDASVISFSDPKAMTTDVSVHVARSDILIQPKTDKRPKLTSTSPGNGKDKVYLNVPLRLYFSKPMNPQSFLFEDGSATQGSGESLSFKNITMTTQRGTTEPVSCSYMYNPPKLDKTGKVLTITPIADQKAGSTVTIECSLLVTDTFGIPMSESYSFSFVYSGEKDKNPPTVSVSYVIGPNGDWNKNTDTYHYPLVAGNTIKLGLSVNDGDKANPESQLSEIYIRETRVTDNLGNPVNKDEEKFTFIDGVYDNGTYEVPYDIKSSGDGQIKLSCWALDTTGNDGDGKGKLFQADYVFYRDTTPPNAGNISITSAPKFGGYYNSEVHSLAFKATSLADVGPYASKKVEAQIQLVGSNGLHVESDTWFSTSLPSIEIPAFWPDGYVTVNYRLRDYIGDTEDTTKYVVGNVSDWITHSTDIVKKDTNPPTGTIRVSESKSIGSATYMKASGTPVHVTLSSYPSTGESPIIGFQTAHIKVVKPNPAPTTADIVALFKDDTFETWRGKDDYDTSFDVNDNDDHYFYVWFQDAAHNVTPKASPMVSVVKGDEDPPTINEFSVTKLGSASLYNNGGSWFFRIVTTDVQSGFADYKLNLGTISGETRTVSGDKVTITGTLAYTPTVLGDVNLQIDVTDAIGNSTGWKELESGKRIYYDNQNPVDLTARFYPTDDTAGPQTVGGIAYFYKNSTLFTNKKDNHKLTVSLQDLKSDVASYDVTGSGLESPGGSTGRPFDVAPPNTVKTGTYTFNLSFGDGSKPINVKGRDFAENFIEIVKPITLDTTPPAFTMKLTDGTVSSTYFTKDSSTNETAAKEIYGVETTTYHGMGSFKFMVSGINDGGGAGLLSDDYSWTLYRYINGSHVLINGEKDESLLTGNLNDLTEAGAESGLVSIPTVNAGSPAEAQPSSGRYYVSIKLKDNLGTENVEQRIGYVYDKRVPYVPAVRPLKGTTPLPFIGSKYWINGSDVSLQAKVTDELNDTDNEAHDPYGSGVSQITVNSRTYTALDDSYFSDSSKILYKSPGTGSALDWIDIGNKNGSVVSKSFGPVSGTEGTYNLTFTDAMGNPAATSVSVSKDSEGPGISVSASNLHEGYESGVFYVSPASTSVSKTTLIPTFSDAQSGVRAWIMAVSTSPITTAPSIANIPEIISDSASDIGTYNTKWATYAPPVNSQKWEKTDVSTSFTAYTVPGPDAIALFHDTVNLFPNAQARYIRFYALDFAGNISTDNNPDNYTNRVFKMDDTKPVITRVKINDDMRATNNNRVSISVDASDIGSGLLNLVFSGITLESINNVNGFKCTVSETKSTVTFDPSASGRNPLASQTFTFYGTIPADNGERTVSVVAHDAVMNESATNENTKDTIIFDTEKPVLGDLKIARINGKFVDSNIIDLEIPIAIESFSGIEKITFDTTDPSSVFDSIPSNIEITKGESDEVITGWFVNNNTITLPTGIKKSDVKLILNGIVLKSTIQNGTVALKVTDFAGNISDPASVTGLYLDDEKPSAVSLSLEGTPSGLLPVPDGYTGTKVITAYVTVTENISGVETFVFSGVSIEKEGTDKTKIFRKGSGNTYTEYTVKYPDENPEGVIQINLTDATTYPKGSGQIFKITGLMLNEPTEEKLKEVKVRVKDLASNPSEIMPSPESIIFDGSKPNPPKPVHAIIANSDVYRVSGTDKYFVKSSKVIDFTINTPSDPVQTGHTGTPTGVPETGYLYTTSSSFSVSATPFTSGSTTLSPNTYYFWSKDRAGNVSETSTEINIINDSTPPQYPVVTPTDGEHSGVYNSVWYYNSTLGIALSGGADAETGAGRRRYGYCTLANYNSTTPAESTITWDVPSSLSCEASENNSNRKYYFFSQDNVGNISLATELTTHKDTTDPAAPTLTTPASADKTMYRASYDSGTSTYTFYTSLSTAENFTLPSISSSEVERYSCNNGVSIPSNIMAVTSTLDNVKYTITAHDFAGNSKDTTLNFQRDAKEPNTPTISNYAVKNSGQVVYKKTGEEVYYTTDSKLVFTMASTDPTDHGISSGVKYFQAKRVSDNILVDSTGTTLELDAKTASATWEISAYDFVNNKSTGSISVTIQCDTEIPAVTVSPTDNGNTYYDTTGTIWYAQNKITFSLSGTDDVSGVKEYYYSTDTTISDDDDKTVTASTEIDATDTETTYYFYVKDNCGRYSNLSSGYKLKKDESKPGLSAGMTTITATPSPIHQIGTGTYFKSGTFSFTPEDTGSASGLYLITNSSSATVAQVEASTKTWTSGTAVTGIKLEDCVPNNASVSNVVYVHLLDNVGNLNVASFKVIYDATHDNWWCDTIAPSCSTITANGNFYFKGEDLTNVTGKATLFYNSGTTSLSSSDLLTSGTIAIDPATLVTSITVTDKLGNSRDIAMTYTGDTKYPTITIGNDEPGNDEWPITASDDESSLEPYIFPSTKFICKYRNSIDDTWTVNDGAWSETFTHPDKGSQLYRLCFDKGNVYSWEVDSVTKLPANPPVRGVLPKVDGADYFLVIATDGVGHRTAFVLQRDWVNNRPKTKTNGVVLTAYNDGDTDNNDNPINFSRRGFVPPSGGDVGTGYEYETLSPVKNAWSATGDSLIDWKSGYPPSKPLRQNVVATEPVGKNGKRSLTVKKTGKAAKAAKPSDPVDVDSFHRLALGETGARSDATPTTTTTSLTASFALNIGIGESVVNTQLLPDSAVEARVSVIAPLAEKFMAMRGVRFAHDPQADARNQLLALVRAGTDGGRVRDRWSQETPQPADIGGIGVDRPVAGILPGKSGKKG